MPTQATSAPAPFWKLKKLEQMSPMEWESLCDGCGRCCLHKLEDEETGEIHFTNVACRLLDLGSCRCKFYNDRTALVGDCIALTPADVGKLRWLPSTCAYRLLAEGKDLPDWHPLVCSQPESVHAAGISVRKFAVSECQVNDVADHILDESL